MGLCVTALGLTLPAYAQHETWHLAWSAPRGCPSEHTVEAKIRARLSGDAGARVNAQVRVTAEGATFHVAIRLSGDVEAQRMLNAESCEAAADATALLVGMAIDPDARSADASIAQTTTADRGDANTSASADTARKHDTTSTEISDTAQDPDPTADEIMSEPSDALTQGDDVTDTRDAENGPVLGVDAGLGLGLDWGTLPGPSAGGLVQVNLRVARVLLSITGSGWWPREVSIASDASVAIGWWAATAEACHLSGKTLQIGPCLGLDVGRYRWRAGGLSDHSAAGIWAAFATAAVVGRARLTNPLYASLWVGVRTPLSYPELLVVGAGEVFSPARVGAHATLLLTVVLG